MQGCAAPALEETASPVQSFPTYETPEIVVEAEIVVSASAGSVASFPVTPSPHVTAAPTPTPTPIPFFPVKIPDDQRIVSGLKRTDIANVLFDPQQQRYIAYGSFGDEKPLFYECSSNGTVNAGSESLDLIGFVPYYAPADSPKTDGERILVVYLPTQCVVAFRAEFGEWKEERIMICSTGRKNHETPVGNFKIYQRYEYKLLGTEDSPCYGLWACRFKTHHLFHSVPISAQAGRDPEKGHRMTNMKKYEKLGTVASDGCIRLTVVDAKWIYDFSADGTVAVRVTRDRGPVPSSPPSIKWEEPYTNKKGFGWDPTDPHSDNPYHLLGESSPGN